MDDTAPHPPRRRSQTWFRGRSYDAPRQLETFFVCAAAGVIFNRVFLILTGYPQIGNATLHISHAIWGALAMMVALAFTLAFLAPALRNFIAVLGGLGFGWFVDELGKFISRDVDYLFKPALAVIYCVFIAMFFWFRMLAGRRYDSEDAIVNALESLKAAGLGNLSGTERAVALRRLDAHGPSTPFAAQVRALLADVPASPPLPEGRLTRAGHRWRLRYEHWTRRPSFVVVVEAIFVVIALAVIGSVLGAGIADDWFGHFSSRIAGAATVATSGCIVVGAVLLPRHRMTAFRWFDRGVLVWILVVQIFLFDRDQFGATMGLLVALAVWAMLRSAMAIEEQRERTEAENGDGPAAGVPTTEVPPADPRVPTA